MRKLDCVLIIAGIIGVVSAIMVTPDVNNLRVYRLVALGRGFALLALGATFLLLAQTPYSRVSMRRNLLYRLALSAIWAGIVLVYSREILPRLSWDSDFAQDYVGARALLNETDELYPVLGPAFAEMGLQWDVPHRSTHPPTTFLIVLPFALLDYRSALILWMAVMFGCIVLTARVLGLSWTTSGLAGIVCLLWPPAIWSLYQVTPIWMLGLALAYRYRHHPRMSGALVSLASLPKLFAAPALLYHFLRRQWRALVGFGTVWGGALALLLLLRGDAINAYVSANVSNSLEQTLRPDNGALLVVTWRLGGWLGVGAAAALILSVLWSSLHSEGLSSWASVVWLGIALLPIAWVYSLLPLLPWLVLAFPGRSLSTRILAATALLVPYVAAAPTQRPWAVTLAIVVSGVTFSMANSAEDLQDDMNSM